MEWKRPVALALSLGLAPAHGQGSAEAPLATAPAERFMPLEAIVNGAKGGTWPFVERSGVLYAPREALDEWRVQLRPNAQPITVRGGEYLPLSAIPGFESKLNFPNQSIELTFSPQVFGTTKLPTELGARPKPSKVLPSVFFNYDLNYSISKPRGGIATTDLGVLTEVGASNSWGVLTSSHVGRNLSAASVPGSSRGWLRLETTFTQDLPDKNRTLRLGDAVTRVGMWGRSVYFAGVQYGTNFALTPGYVTQPLPVFNGISTSPSTVELYVNDVLRQTSNVPTGPFAIDNTAALSGGGEARLVVRDLLGREVVIVQPFFTDAQLLAKGLSDWNVEAGSLRKDLGLANANYGAAFGTGLWRYGLSDRLTLEGRGELTHESAAMGLGVNAALPLDFLGKAALVTSHHKGRERGSHWVLGLERQWWRSAMQVQTQGASRSFSSLGQEARNLPIKFQAAGNFTHSIDEVGTFGLGLARIDRFDQPRVTTISASYSTRVGRQSNLSVYLNRVLGEAKAMSIRINLNVQLENNLQLSATAGSRGGAHDYYLSANQFTGTDQDFGWRALAGRVQSRGQAEGGVYYAGRNGRISADVSTSSDQTSLRAGASGALIMVDNRFFATRRLEQSFAVAEIKDYAGVGVGLGNSVMARTDASGVALVPYLAAYQSNSIRVDAKDLPVSAEIDNIEQFVVPSWRSAVKVDFPVRSGRAALLRIRLDNNDVAPAGAVVQISGDNQEFFVARRGEAFVTGLQPSNRLALRWKGQECSFDVALPPASADEIARVGPLLCKGVRP